MPCSRYQSRPANLYSIVLLKRELRMTLDKRTLIVSVVASAFLIVMPTSAAAQARPNPGPRNTPSSTPDGVLDMRIRDMNIRRLEIERENAAKPTLEVSKETVKQVNEDFGRIQGINSEIMRDYASGAPPDYKHIAEAMAEIKKRAARLNTNLLLPPDEEVPENQATPSNSTKRKARSPLLDLNDLINGFVTNPIFKNVNTIDLALGLKAKRDLANIIDLSDRISKSAEKLSKAATKPN